LSKEEGKRFREYGASVNMMSKQEQEDLSHRTTEGKATQSNAAKVKESWNHINPTGRDSRPLGVANVQNSA
jgi:hypothetical protein